jgi:hypothetical protein
MRCGAKPNCGGRYCNLGGHIEGKLVPAHGELLHLVIVPPEAFVLPTLRQLRDPLICIGKPLISIVHS